LADSTQYSAVVQFPLLCPHCADRNVEAVPDAPLYAVNLPQQKTPLSGSVFRCSQWHIFAVFPSELRPGSGQLAK
jgi:hypothetical protein